MKKILLLILLTLTFGYMQNASAFSEQDSCVNNGINYALATTLLNDLKAALIQDDKNKIADLISYPLRVNDANSKRHVIVKSKTEFLQKYDTLFSTPNKKRLLGSNNIFCNFQGAMLGGGAVWFKTKENSAKIYVINIMPDKAGG